MRFTIPVVLTLLIFISLSLQVAEAGYATVFLYHKFNEPASPTTSISTAEFESQLRFLKEDNYNVISLPDLIELIKDRVDIPEKTAVITIDDGYRSVYTHAFPLLKRYGFPFTVFLYMEAIGRYPDYMTLEELQDMKGYGKVTFGNHSYSHLRLARWPGGMSRTDYLRWLEGDLLKSEEQFKERLGYRPEFYAFPYGEYNREFVEAVEKHGYMAALTQDPGSTGVFTNRYLIPRNAVVGSWAKMEKFKDFLNTEPLHVAMVYPPYGTLKENPPRAIEGRIINQGSYKNFGIYLSELGWIKPSVKKDSGIIYTEGIRKLTRKTNRIGFTALNTGTGRTATYFYMIILSNNKD